MFINPRTRGSWNRSIPSSNITSEGFTCQIFSKFEVSLTEHEAYYISCYVLNQIEASDDIQVKYYHYKEKKVKEIGFSSSFYITVRF